MCMCVWVYLYVRECPTGGKSERELARACERKSARARARERASERDAIAGACVCACVRLCRVEEGEEEQVSYSYSIIL
jgi:hypothetical protein